MFDLLSFFKYIILILFRKKKIHSFVKCIVENDAVGVHFNLKKYVRMFVFIRESAIFAPSKLNDTRFGSSAG